MVMQATKQEIIDKLRQDISTWEGFRPPKPGEAESFGLGPIENAFPGRAFPTGVLPWGKGVIITAAPEIFYAEDTKRDGHCDYRKTLYSGFTEGNQQHRINGLLWGLDMNQRRYDQAAEMWIGRADRWQSQVLQHWWDTKTLLLPEQVGFPAVDDAGRVMGGFPR